MAKAKKRAARKTWHLSDAAARDCDEIAAIIARFAATHEGNATEVPGLSVARITAPVPPTTHSSAACLCLCVRGSRRVAVGDAVFIHEEGRFLLSAIELPSIVAIPDASSATPYTALRIDFDLAVARQVIAEIEVNGQATNLSDSCLTTGELDADLLGCITRLVRLIERPSEAAFMAKLLHREILFRVLSGPVGGRLRQIARLGSQSQRVSKAIEWLREHYRERLRIEQLANVAGMGVSTLHRRFVELTSMSPIQYQKQLRLHEARRLMLEDELDVATTALKIGYESSTQFSREYHRLFGDSPARDIKHLRAIGGSQASV